MDPKAIKLKKLGIVRSRGSVTLTLKTTEVRNSGDPKPRSNKIQDVWNSAGLNHQSFAAIGSKDPGGSGPCSSENLECSQNLCSDICANIQWSSKCIIINIHTFIQLCPSAPSQAHRTHTHTHTFTYFNVIHWDVVLNTLGQISGEKEAQYLCCLGPDGGRLLTKQSNFPAQRQRGSNLSSALESRGRWGCSAVAVAAARNGLRSFLFVVEAATPICCSRKKGKNWDRIKENKEGKSATVDPKVARRRDHDDHDVLVEFCYSTRAARLCDFIYLYV